MRVSLHTDGQRDHILLTPENLVEATDLVRIALSPFMPEGLTSLQAILRDVLALRIYVKDENLDFKKLTPEERLELDTTA